MNKKIFADSFLENYLDSDYNTIRLLNHYGG